MRGHVCARTGVSREAFAHRTGISVVHVPYKGGVNQYTIEPMSGYIDFASLQIFNVAPFVKQSKLRVLAAGIKESRELFIKLRIGLSPRAASPRSLNPARLEGSRWGSQMETQCS